MPLILNSFSEIEVYFMENNIIEVEYTDLPEEPQPEGNIPIPSEAGLPTAILKTVADVFNNVTNSIKEYSMLKEQEKTKRAEIKMQLKLGLEQIQAQKEVLLTDLNNRHERDMTVIRLIDEEINKRLDANINAVNAAIECAQKNNDFSAVMDFLEMMNSTQALSVECRLKLMAQTSGMPRLDDNSKPFGYLK